MMIEIVSQLVFAKNLHIQKSQEKIALINSFLEMRKVPTALRQTIRLHFKEVYKQRPKDVDVAELLRELPNELEHQLHDKLFADMNLDRLWFWDVLMLSHRSDQTMREFALSLEPQRVRRGQTIFFEGQLDESLYFVVKGCVLMSQTYRVLWAARLSELRKQLAHGGSAAADSTGASHAQSQPSNVQGLRRQTQCIPVLEDVQTTAFLFKDGNLFGESACTWDAKLKGGSRLFTI